MTEREGSGRYRVWEEDGRLPGRRPAHDVHAAREGKDSMTTTAHESSSLITGFDFRFAALADGVARVVKGKPEVIEAALCCLLAGGTS